MISPSNASTLEEAKCNSSSVLFIVQLKWKCIGFFCLFVYTPSLWIESFLRLVAYYPIRNLVERALYEIFQWKQATREEEETHEIDKNLNYAKCYETKWENILGKFILTSVAWVSAECILCMAWIFFFLSFCMQSRAFVSWAW